MGPLSLRQELSQRLWKKYFDDVKSVVGGLEAFSNEVALEDEFNVTYWDFWEKITAIVERIDHCCPHTLLTGCTHSELQRLCIVLVTVHRELRLQRDAICQCNPEFRYSSKGLWQQVFSVARSKVEQLGNDLKVALETLMHQLSEREESETPLGVKKEPGG